MAQLRQHESELEEQDVQVKVVTFDADFMALAYLRETNLKWPILLDSQQSVYADYGFQRASWWALYNPLSIWGYLKLVFRGTFPGQPGSDWQQLGGDVVIDPAGNIRLHHISSNPHDRPSIESLLPGSIDCHSASAQGHLL